jgi:hypothetical protein
LNVPIVAFFNNTLETILPGLVEMESKDAIDEQIFVEWLIHGAYGIPRSQSTGDFFTLKIYLFRSIKPIITLIIKDMEVAIAAPIMPNSGINNTFNIILIVAVRTATLNEMFIFPILCNAPPTEMIGAKLE